MQTGDPQESLNFFREARSAFASAGDRLGEAEAISGMGRASVALKQYGQLLPWYKTKLRLAQKAGNLNHIASAQANLGDVYELKREFARAEAFYSLSLKGYRAVPNPLGEGRVLIHLAHVYSEQGKFPQAIAALTKARELKEKTGQVEEVAQIDYELASIHRKEGRLEDAKQAIQNTIAIIESQRLKMSAFDSRAAYFASVHQYYSLYIQLLMLLHAGNSQNHLAIAALEASERSKVRSLLDWLAGHGQDTPCDELLKKQAETPAALAPAAGSNVAPSPSETSPALTLDQIRAEIAGDDAVLLEYALGDEKSYVWVVNGEQLSAHELPSLKRLNELVQAFRAAVTARQARAGESNGAYLARIGKADRDYRRYRAQLSQILLGPVSLAGAKRIIIVPDGPLQYVSFAALSVPDEEGGRAILAAHHEVIMLPSASALGALRKAVALRPAPTATAAVFADPVYELHDTARPLPNASQGRGVAFEPPSVARSEWLDVHGSKHVPRLIWSGAEADEVGKLGNANQVFVARRFQASRDNVLNHDLGSYRIVHFATHGVADARHPERSGLVLSLFDTKGRPQDGYLRLSDIYGLKLSADLVVLSSCDSGLGKDLSSEGIIGLPRAFLRAGASSVIATLWKVDDQATAELMTYFYARLRQGKGPASALHESQVRLSQDPRWSHPYYWAAFVLQGDYRLSGVK
jgi:CHAT domain-containing protein